MKITPVDLAHKVFDKKMFGVDESQVVEYLTQIASAMEELIRDRNSLRDKLRERDLQLVEYRERDGLLKSTITTASQMADKLRQDADREAKLILTDAEQKAEMITRNGHDSLKKMYQEITELKRTRLQFEANLKAMAQAHLALIEQGERYMPGIGLPQVTMEEATSRNTNVSPLSANGPGPRL
jgi:cell division initiation protein